MINEWKEVQQSSVSPAGQAIVQHRIVGLKNYHTVEPALGEEITTMVIYNIPPFFHNVLKLITYLQNHITIDTWLNHTLPQLKLERGGGREGVHFILDAKKKIRVQTSSQFILDSTNPKLFQLQLLQQ